MRENIDEIYLDKAEAEFSSWLAGQQLDGARQQRFENLVTKRILKYMGITVPDGKLRNLYAEHYGIGDLTPAGAAELFKFPLYLAARKLPYIQELTVPFMLGKKFGKSKLARTFFEVWEEKPATWDGAIGLAFQWPGMEGDYGILVMHNLSSDLFNGFGKITRHFEIEGEPFDVVIETLESLLTAVYGPRGAPES